MSNLTTKQKIILGCIIGVMLIVIGIYGYISLHNQDETYISQIEESEMKDNTELNNELSKNNQNIVGNSALENKTNSSNSINSNKIGSNINGYENLEGKIVVHIIGEVKKTGILILQEGARIADAIESAGGATSEADLDEVNLAYVLKDGQKIYIPNKKDKAKEEKTYITSESGNNVIEENEDTGKGVNKKVNINIASQSELENLPGIGSSIASRIIEYREQNGKFQKIEDLQNVKGIGDAKFGNIKEYVTVN